MTVINNMSPGVAIDSKGHAVSYITMAETVKLRGNESLADFINYNHGEPLKRDRITMDNAIVLILDDVTNLHYNNYKSLLIDKGFSATFALRQDYITSSFTYEMLLEMQQDGMDIAYHGNKHSFGSQDMDADLDAFNEEAKTKGKNINFFGCITPNGYGVTDKFKAQFPYYRGGGLNNVANVSSLQLQEGFGSIATCFIDDLTSDSNLTTLKNSITTLLTGVHNKTLCLSMHMNANNMPYLEQFLSWCKENNIPVVSARTAFEYYVMSWGGMKGTSSIYKILSNTETDNYFIVAGNGKVRTNQFGNNS